MESLAQSFGMVSARSQNEQSVFMIEKVVDNFLESVLNY